MDLVRKSRGGVVGETAMGRKLGRLCPASRGEKGV